MAQALNQADIIRELQGHWQEVLMAVMRKCNIKEVTILPEDMEFMVPPFAQTGGKQPMLACIGLRDVRERGGFTLVNCSGRDEVIDLMAKFQRDHPQTKLKEPALVVTAQSKEPERPKYVPEAGAPAPVTAGLTTDRDDPRLSNAKANGQNEVYLVLSEEERAKGFVRPVRRSYKHVGTRPKYPLRDLTNEEKEHYKGFNYAKFEAYPQPYEDGSSVIGKYWTEAQLKSGCGVVTTMGLALCETYARNPKFYGATFCVRCGTHLPVAEFNWIEANGSMGPTVGT